jgi:hypothetical protein
MTVTVTEMLSTLVMTGPDFGTRLLVAASTRALRAKYPRGDQ